MMYMLTLKSLSGFLDRASKQAGCFCSLILFLLASVAALGQDNPSPCEETTYFITVDGGSYDSEVSWELIDEDETVLASGGAPLIDEPICLADGCYTLLMFDSFGDGWNGNEFSLSLDGEIVSGPITLPNDAIGTGSILLGGPALSLSAVDELGNPIDCAPAEGGFYVEASLNGGSENESYTVSFQGGDPLSISANGSLISSESFPAGTDVNVELIAGLCNVEETISLDECPPSCAENEALYFITVDGGIFDNEVSWDLYNTSDEIVASGGAPLINEPICLADGCYQLEMADSWGDGWNGNEFTLSLNEEVIAGPFTITNSDNDGEFNSATVTVGDADCTPSCLPPSEIVTEIVSNCAEGTFDVIISLSEDGTGVDFVITNDVDGQLGMINPNSPTASFTFESGTSPTITAETLGIQDCTISETVSYTCPPANDLPCFAAPIACGETIEGSTSGATEDSEPGFCGTSPGAPGVWYILEGNGQEITASLCGSGYDSKINVYTNACILLECVAGNDDFCGLQSEVNFTAAEGQDYWIYVNGWSSSVGDFSLSIACQEAPAPPANDECADAISIEVDAEEPFVFDNTSATSGDAGDCDAWFDGLDNDIWVSFVAPAEGILVIETFAGSNTDTQLQIFDACGGNSIACDDDGGASFMSRIEIACGDYIPGQTYFIQIDGYDAEEGDFSISVITEACPDPCADVVCEDDGDPCTEISCVDGECITINLPDGDNDGVCDAEDGCPEDENKTEPGACGCGIADLDEDQDLIADCADDCVGFYDAIGVCNGNCEADLNQNGICDSEEEPAIACADFRYYLSDVNDGVSDIYEVVLDESEGEAQLTLLANLDYAAHIAFNEVNNLLYLINSSNGEFQTLDPSGNLGGIQVPDTDESLTKVVTAVFNEEGKLLIGDENSGKIYIVDVVTNSVNLFLSGIPISGGDLAFSGSNLYLATRSGSGDLRAIDGGTNPVIGDLPSTVTGMAMMADGNLIVSARDASQLVTRTASNPSIAGSAYDLILSGVPFESFNGDMASGCFSGQPNEGDCDNFSTFYANHGPGVSGTDLYRLDYIGSDANLTPLINVNYEAHIGFNAQANIVYLVKANGAFVELYDAGTDAIVAQVPINGNINALYAVVYNPADGLLYVGDANDDEIYTIDLITGDAVFYADAPVQGGDLVLIEGVLYLAKRSTNDLFTVVADADGIADGVSEATLIGSIPDETNGAAAANNSTGIVAAQFGTSLFTEISAVDGSFIQSYTAKVNGQIFTLTHGDMASGCADDDLVIDDCEYKLYYTHQPQGGSYSLLEVELSGDGTASVSTLQENIGSAHIALSPDGATLYIVGGSSLRILDLPTNSIVGEINIESDGGQNLSGFPAAVADEDGTLYIAGGNKVYTLDPATGIATQFGPNRNVNGGDLIVVDGELWIITRNNNTFTNVLSGESFVVPVNEINGAAVLPNGNVLVADGNGEGLFKEIEIASQSVVAEYETGLELYNGDLAGRCIQSTPSEEIVPGTCGAAQVIEYNQGVRNNGGALPANRTDANQALGEPEGIDELVFVTLGYNGSIILGFDGAVLNLEGADLEIVETSYGNAGCAAYPEYALVSVSADGINWSPSVQVCKSNNLVDISDLGDYEYVYYVKIENDNDNSTSPDGFDVDGVRAIHNCLSDEEGEEEEAIAQVEAAANLTSYPNPTSGPSQVVFEVVETQRTLVEVYDMNGRNVATLFNQEAQAGQEYLLNFDGASLPNGIYIYRLTTGNEVIMDKFMIAR